MILKRPPGEWLGILRLAAWVDIISHLKLTTLIYILKIVLFVDY